MPDEKTPLFVRLPKQQVAALDRLAGRTGRPKQHLLSELLADRLAAGPLSVGRVDVAPSQPVTGDDVLTVEEAAALFKVSPAAIHAAAERGTLPGRRFDHDWRFSKVALLAWLGMGERVGTRHAR